MRHALVRDHRQLEQPLLSFFHFFFRFDLCKVNMFQTDFKRVVLVPDGRWGFSFVASFEASRITSRWKSGA
jgi:hypothetical protein